MKHAGEVETQEEQQLAALRRRLEDRPDGGKHGEHMTIGQQLAAANERLIEAYRVQDEIRRRHAS